MIIFILLWLATGFASAIVIIRALEWADEPTNNKGLTWGRAIATAAITLMGFIVLAPAVISVAFVAVSVLSKKNFWKEPVFKHRKSQKGGGDG